MMVIICNKFTRGISFVGGGLRIYKPNLVRDVVK